MIQRRVINKLFPRIARFIRRYVLDMRNARSNLLLLKVLVILAGPVGFISNKRCGT